MAKKKVNISTTKGKKGMTDSPTKSRAKKKQGFDFAGIPEELADRAQEIWMAGVGALSTVEKEGVRIFENLVEKGQEWEQARLKRLGSAKDKVGTAVKETAAKSKEVGGNLEGRLDQIQSSFTGLFERFSGSVRADVADLAKRVDDLAAQLEKLAANQGAPDTLSAPTIYEVVPHEEGWAFQKQGAARATSLHGTKKEAVEQARSTAAEHAPSQLVIRRKDGTIQDNVSYGAE